MSVILALAAAMGAQEPDRGAVNAWIDRQDTANGALFVARASADKGFSGSYRLVVEKTGAGGTSKTRQGGAATVAPGETVTLSSVALGGSSGDWRVVLELLHDDRVVVQDILESRTAAD